MRHDPYSQASAPPVPVPPPAKPKAKARPARAAAPPPVSCITVTHNQKLDGIEIRFPGKPDEPVRARLKAAGFRWSLGSHCWYQRNGPGVLACATRFRGEQHVPKVQTPAPAAPPIPAPIPIQFTPEPAERVVPVTQAPALPSSWRDRLLARSKTITA